MAWTQFPLVARYALSVNKAQGLTMKGGLVFHLRGDTCFWPASKHGLPFVAFTRSESFAMTAFKNIPPCAHFVKGQGSDVLRIRLAFTGWLKDMHIKRLARHSLQKTREDENEAHQQWCLANSTSQRRHKKAGPFMPCPCCVL